MGVLWLRNLPAWLDDAGLQWRTWPGWESRARSSGGYDELWAVIVHHTASNTTPDSDCSYMWDNAEDRPIGALLLDRGGRVTIGAAGATNCAGKGGPLICTNGVIPADKGNTYALNVEAANAGTGEAWPTVQQDAYTLLVSTLCDRLGLDPDLDVAAHFEYTERKIDPAGQSRYAVGSSSWNMTAFRDDLDVSVTSPLPEPDPIPEEATVLFAAQSKETGHYWIGDGIHRRRITKDWSDDFWQFAEWGVGPVVIPFASDPRSVPPPDRVRTNADFTDCAESTLDFLGEIIDPGG